MTSAAATCNNYETAAGAAKETAQAAFAALQEADIASGNAGAAALVKAMDAGDAAIALGEFAPKRGKQKFLKESASAPLSTIKLCMKLAQGRDRIEKEMASSVGQMSIRGAVRLLRPKEKKKKPLTVNLIAWTVMSDLDFQSSFGKVRDIFLKKMSADHKGWLHTQLAQEFGAVRTATRAPNGAPYNTTRNLLRDIGATE